MSHPSTVCRPIQVEHVAIETPKPFEAVKAALESLVPPLDAAIPEALRRGDIVRANQALQRVVLDENEAGRAVFEYDRPSSLFGQFADERVTTVGRELDRSLERALVTAAG